jgi:hypothetical protein
MPAVGPIVSGTTDFSWLLVEQCVGRPAVLLRKVPESAAIAGSHVRAPVNPVATRRTSRSRKQVFALVITNSLEGSAMRFSL